MGIEEETDRTLFIRNLDQRVTEELLFELFLQAGPLTKTKIPKDSDGKQKTFGFAVYKHEVSVPYAMQLLDGTSLFGRTIHVQFRSGSSHSSSPGNSQNSSPANTPNPHGQRTPIQFSSPPYTPPQMQRSFSTPDNLQKHAMMNNLMWQLHMQQLEQINGSFSKPLQRQPTASGNSGGGGSRQHDNVPYRHPSHTSSGARNQRYADDSSSGRQQQHSHSRDNYHHQSDRSGSRHHDSRGGHRHHDDRGSNRGYQDNRWRRY
ncbi:RNA-binding protein 7-like [Seriola dumerili]|uniref:RNA binding motif protein 7 n=1 Tax=Seriola dumerili TaxID=41447 RepID=A0A3B4TMR6_SERDU|nr:RNA-binding protein 7-like [Seriola dumerili]